MNPLPIEVYTAEQVRALDRRASEALGIASYILMERAGRSALDVVQSCWPAAQRIVVICGPGNNGGDGYVFARLAREARLDVVVAATADPARLKGNARRACDEFISAGGAVQPWSDQHLQGADLIVDAILGTGLTRPLEPATAAQVRAMNANSAPILALDIPSGLHADTGAVLGAAVVAQRTLGFVGLKLGFYLGEGLDYAGIVMFDGLGAPPAVLASIEPAALRISAELLTELLPPRRRTTHKGAQGRVLVLGGGIGMAGAVRMAGEAALRVGAGLVTVATRMENVAAIVSARPELICRGVDRVEELQPLLDSADILALGPGLGQDEWARAMLDAALVAGKPAVIDADGLNLLAQNPRRNAHWILTPHPGEAARLLGVGAEKIQSDRLGSARAIVDRYGGTIVLKGAGTLVVDGESPPSICDRGNPGMASAGMGDVLTGVIAGIAAQVCRRPTFNLSAAARAGVLVHAMAGDRAAARGQRGLLATDLFEHLPTCVNPSPFS